MLTSTENLRLWLTSTLGLSADGLVRDIIQQVTGTQGSWSSEQLLIQPTPGIKGTLTQVVVSRRVCCDTNGDEALKDCCSWTVTVDSCHLVLNDETSDKTIIADYVVSKHSVDGVELQIRELHIVSVLRDSANIVQQLYHSIFEIEFIASTLSIQSVCVWDTLGEQHAQAHEVIRSGRLWKMAHLDLFGAMKLEKVTGSGTKFTCQKIISIPQTWGWRLLSPVEGACFHFPEQGNIIVQWPGEMQVEEVEDPSDEVTNQCRYENINLEGDEITLNFREGWKMSCTNFKLLSDDDAMDGLVTISCDTVSIPNHVQFENIRFSGSIERDGHAIHLCLVSVKSMLLEANEKTLCWLDTIKGSLTSSFDAVHSPYAKVGETNCRVRLQGLDQATSGIPFVTVGGKEFDFETSVGTVVRFYAAQLSNLITSKKEFSKQLQSDISDSMAASIGRMVFSVGAATPVGIATSFAAVGATDGVSAAATVGKESRGASSHDSYQFGDVTRGIATSFRCSKKEAETNLSNPKELNKEGSSSYLQENKDRYAKLGGTSVGAAVGLTLIGGPIGFVAGSLLGGSAAKNAMEIPAGARVQASEPIRQYDDFEPANTALKFPLPEDGTNDPMPTQERREENRRQYVNCEAPGYRFGDLTRGVVARGKKSAGRSDDSYKFGDFTRGLFSST